MNQEVIMNEDARNDWLKLVKQHKKKQKGLPALSTLNTDAGNVEHNVEMFNHMQPSECVPVSPISGSMAEGLSNVDEEEMITLEYRKLPVEYAKFLGLYYDPNYGGMCNDNYDYYSDKVDFEYEVSKEDVLEVLGDDFGVQTEYWLEDMTADEYDAVLKDKFDEILSKYMHVVKEHFYEDALEAATDKFEDSFYEELLVKECEEQLTEDAKLDDTFNMTLRALL